MNQFKWNSGPPPHAGWWLTKETEEFPDPALWRFYNGDKHYSPGMSEYSSKESARCVAMLDPKCWHIEELLWSDHWPENARVPRIDPRKA